jgi:hypothetical protein
MYVPGYVKAPGVPYALGKKYLAKLAAPGLPLLIGREEFRRASEAEAAAKVWKDRLEAEYEATLLKMVEDESTAEGAEVVEPTA